MAGALEPRKAIPCYRDKSGRDWWMGQCNHCGLPLLVLGDGVQIYPELSAEPVDERIPGPMRTDLCEAKQNMVAGSFNSAAVMARRALQSLAMQKGAPPGRKLHEQLEHLKRKVRGDG